MCFTNLQRLHQVRLDGIFHQHSQSAAHTLQWQSAHYLSFASTILNLLPCHKGNPGLPTRSSVVTGCPLRLEATTILARRWRMSSRLLVRASTAIISLATVMSNWAWRTESSGQINKADLSTVEKNPLTITCVYKFKIHLLRKNLNCHHGYIHTDRVHVYGIVLDFNLLSID